LIHSGAGQSVGYFNEINSVQVIMNKLVTETVEALKQQRQFLRP